MSDPTSLGRRPSRAFRHTVIPFTPAAAKRGTASSMAHGLVVMV